MEITHTTIVLDGMRFHAFHGVMEQERRIGAEFDVSLRIVLNPKAQAYDTDLLADTINYAEVYHIVKAEMGQPSQLLEHVAGRILKRILENFSLADEAHIVVRKIAPPIEGDCRVSAVEMTATR